MNREYRGLDAAGTRGTLVILFAARATTPIVLCGGLRSIFVLRLSLSRLLEELLATIIRRGAAKSDGMNNAPLEIQRSLFRETAKWSRKEISEPRDDATSHSAV